MVTQSNPAQVLPKTGDRGIDIHPGYAIVSSRIPSCSELTSLTDKRLVVRMYVPQKTHTLPVRVYVPDQEVPPVQAYSAKHVDVIVRHNSQTTEMCQVDRGDILHVRVAEDTPKELIDLLHGRGVINAPLIEVKCEPVYIETETTSAASLQGIVWKVNSLQYTEIELDLGEVYITEIVGLPNGMSFDDDKIKGTPTTGGVYGLSMILNTGSPITGAIHVSVLERRK